MKSEIKRIDVSIADRLIEGIFDGVSAKEAVDGMERLRKLLEAAEQFGQYACQFCVAEAKMWLQIASIEGADAQLTKAKKELVDWIRSKTQDELDAIMAQCQEGVRITLIKKREQREDPDIKRLREFNRIADGIRTELAEHGSTRLSSEAFYEQWGEHVKPRSRDVRAFVERTRDELLRNGAVGLGDGSGTYVVPEKCVRTDVAKAVQARLESIVNDLRSLSDICRRTGFAVPEAGVTVLSSLVKELGAPCQR